MWQQSIVPGGASTLINFWKQVNGHPALVGHPLHMRDKSRCVPIGMHCDEVPVTGRGKIWCKSASVFSWFSLLCAGSATRTLNSLFFIWAAYEKLFVDGDEGTLQTLMIILEWSLAAMWVGKWPETDWRGVRILHWIQHFLHLFVLV